VTSKRHKSGSKDQETEELLRLAAKRFGLFKKDVNFIRDIIDADDEELVDRLSGGPKTNINEAYEFVLDGLQSKGWTTDR